MKALYVVSLAVLTLIPTISGTAEMQPETASIASNQSAKFEHLAQLKAQAAASDATLRRPL